MFEKVQVVLPESIADISLELFNEERATYSIQVVMSDGSIQVKSGDVLPHLSASQKSGLVSLMASLRTKAQALVE